MPPFHRVDLHSYQVRKRLDMHRTRGKRKHDSQASGSYDQVLELEGPKEEVSIEETGPRPKPADVSKSTSTNSSCSAF